MKQIFYTAIHFTFLLMISFYSQSQVNKYNFSESAGNYQQLTGGLVIPFTDPTQHQDALPIGFSFKFGGKIYNNFCLSPNGMIKLSDATGSLPWNHFLADFGRSNPSAPLIAPMWAYGGVGTVSCIVRGQAPYRVLVIDWYRTIVKVNTTLKASCQLKLYETTNHIEFIYGSNFPAEANFNIPVGLNDATTWLNIISDTVSYASGSDSTNAYPLNKLAGKMFTFFPPCAQPSDISITDITTRSAQLNWDPVFYSLNYMVYVSRYPQLPDVNPDIADMTTVAEPSFLITMLLPSQTYYVFVKTLCGGPYNDGWIVKAFTTACAMPTTCFCPEPTELTVSDVNMNGATISWVPDATVHGYETAITTSATPPPYGDYNVSVFSSKISFSNLFSSTHYYFHVRSRCSSTGYYSPSSTWKTIDFVTAAYAGKTVKEHSLQLPTALLKNGVTKIIREEDQQKKAAPARSKSVNNAFFYIEKMYPNPAQNFMDLVLHIKEPGTLTAIVTSVTGKVMLKKTGAVNKGINIIHLDIKGWQKGMYILQLIDTNGNTANEKFIKL